MSQYIPDESEAMDSTRPAKRARTEDHEPSDKTEHNRYRQRSPLGNRGRGDSYRPNYRPDTWTRETNRNRSRNGANSHRQRSASPGRLPQEHTKAGPKKKKTTKDRKENPSSRIHSLRKLLARAKLPATVQQEKERELAGLLFDQQKELIRRSGKKNLKRYHFIRFVERQKASRTIKQLKAKQDAGDTSEEVAKQLHEAEVDMNYAIYSPLAQKYIAIYARDDSAEGKPKPLPRNLSAMNKKDYAMLSDDQRHLIEIASMEAANTFHLGDSQPGVKPPMWYVVEAKMEEGLKALETLRNEQPDPENRMELIVGMEGRKAPDWLKDDGLIDPDDLDSASEEEGGAPVNVEDDEDESMSDADGGFFEKR